MKIKVLVVPVGGPPAVQEIEDTLGEMQRLVGGYIQAVPLKPDVDLYCNEEGKLQGLEPNRNVPEICDVICGDFFISRCNPDGEPMSLTDEDIAEYAKRFM